MYHTPRILIIGGSLGGLTAGLTLRQIGCQVALYERSPKLLIGLGAGIVLHPATIRYLAQQPGFDLDAISVAARTVRYMGSQGSILHEQPFSYRFSSYNTLYRNLLAAFGKDSYHLGHTLIGIEQDEKAVTAHLSKVDGTLVSVSGDLLVCADGIHSTGRRLLTPGVSPAYAGYVAWRGRVQATDVPTDTFAQLCEAITYHIMPNSHLLVYPIPAVGQENLPGRFVEQPASVGGPFPEEARTINWLWYRNVAAGPVLQDLMTDRNGVRRDLALPPGSVQERHIAQLMQDAKQLPPPMRHLVCSTEQPFLQAIVDLEATRLLFGRACLIGDAAFVARPHAAAGTAKAAEDAWRLSQAIQQAIQHPHGDLQDDLQEALQQWEQTQLALGRTVLARTRAAGQKLQVENDWPVGRSLPFGLYETGDSTLV